MVSMCCSFRIRYGANVPALKKRARQGSRGGRREFVNLRRAPERRETQEIVPQITPTASCSASVHNMNPVRPSTRRLRRSIQERGSPCVTRECVTRWRVPIPGSRNGRNAARMRKDYVNAIRRDTTSGDEAARLSLHGVYAAVTSLHSVFTR